MTKAVLDDALYKESRESQEGTSLIINDEINSINTPGFKIELVYSIDKPDIPSFYTEGWFRDIVNLRAEETARECERRLARYKNMNWACLNNEAGICDL